MPPLLRFSYTVVRRVAGPILFVVERHLVWSPRRQWSLADQNGHLQSAADGEISKLANVFELIVVQSAALENSEIIYSFFYISYFAPRTCTRVSS